MMTAGPTGSSFNPARTFGPYVVASLFGGDISWIEFPIYVIGPLIGACLAVFTFDAVTQPVAAIKSKTETEQLNA